MSNQLRRAGRSERGPLGRDHHRRPTPATQLKRTRWAVLKDPAALTPEQAEALDQLRRDRHVLWRAWALKEELRDLYRLPPGRRADAHLDAWLARVCRSRIPAMVRLSRTMRRTAGGSSGRSSSACRTQSASGFRRGVSSVNRYRFPSMTAIVLAVGFLIGAHAETFRAWTMDAPRSSAGWSVALT